MKVFLIFIVALLVAIALVPAFVIFEIKKEWDWTEIKKLYKFLWNSER